MKTEGGGLNVVINNKKSDDTVIAKFDYAYGGSWGSNGTRTQVIEDILTPSGSSPSEISAQVDYEYDDLYRLTHEHRIAYNGGNAGVTYEYNYVYDAAGNRTSKEVVGGSTTSYTYDDANKMTAAGSATFSYDDAGNMIEKSEGGTYTYYTWNYRNLLKQYQVGTGTATNFLYDGMGNRVRTTTYFLLDDLEIAEEITGTNITSYVGPGLISKIAGSTRTVYHPDGIGSARATSDTNQSVAAATIYDAWGNLAQDYPSSSAPSFGFAGQYRYYADSTGLDHLKARYYSPNWGRFIARDPIGYKGGPNLYSYVSNSPTVWVDPDGKFAWWIGCILPCGSAIGRPAAIALGCLAGGATDASSFGKCFDEIWREESCKAGTDAKRCALCLFIVAAKGLEPKLPPPWGTKPPVYEFPVW